VILDNYATDKRPRSRRGSRDIPVGSFTSPNLRLWLNAVGSFFAILTRRRLKRGAFRSVADLQAAINRFLREIND
jgi:hypothetical protein